MNVGRYPISSELTHAITLWPEWAWCIAGIEDHRAGRFADMTLEEFEPFMKRIENRTWHRESLAGKWLAIHAGKTIGGGQSGTSHAFHDVEHMMTRAGLGVMAREGIKEEWITRSAIVAVAQVTGFVVDVAGKPFIHRGKPAINIALTDAPKWWVRTQTGWALTNVIRLPTPVSCSGAQGIWTPDESVREELATQVSLAREASYRK